MCRNITHGGRRCPRTENTKAVERAAAKRYYYRQKARPLVDALTADGIQAITENDVPATYHETTDPNLELGPVTLGEEVFGGKLDGILWSAPGRRSTCGGVKTSWMDLHCRDEDTEEQHLYRITPGPGAVVIRCDTDEQLRAVLAKYPTDPPGKLDLAAMAADGVSGFYITQAGMDAVNADPELSAAFAGWDIPQTAWLRTDHLQASPAKRGRYARDSEGNFDEYDDNTYNLRTWDDEGNGHATVLYDETPVKPRKQATVNTLTKLGIPAILGAEHAPTYHLTDRPDFGLVDIRDDLGNAWIAFNKPTGTLWTAPGREHGGGIKTAWMDRLAFSGEDVHRDSSFTSETLYRVIPKPNAVIIRIDTPTQIEALLDVYGKEDGSVDWSRLQADGVDGLQLTDTGFRLAPRRARTNIFKDWELPQTVWLHNDGMTLEQVPIGKYSYTQSDDPYVPDKEVTEYDDGEMKGMSDGDRVFYRAASKGLSVSRGADLPETYHHGPEGLSPVIAGRTDEYEGTRKPGGALWSAPARRDADGNVKTAWTDLAAREDNLDRQAVLHRVVPAADATVVHITSAADMMTLAQTYPAEGSVSGFRINYEAAAADGIDGIYMTSEGLASLSRDPWIAKYYRDWDIPQVAWLRADKLTFEKPVPTGVYSFKSEDDDSYGRYDTTEPGFMQWDEGNGPTQI